MAAAVLAAASTGTAATTICVGTKPGCFATLKAAVTEAERGDTIKVDRGTFAGGVTITTDVTIVGAGPGATVIRGGGPVLMIGTEAAPRGLRVSISGVTITGGVTHGDRTRAFGGGISVPAASSNPGTTVKIVNSVITGNRVAPTQGAPIGPPCPGNKSCPYAGAGGGGIDSWGNVQLTNSTVSNNVVGGPVASDAEGGGIFEHGGNVALIHCIVSGNRAVAVAPNGRFADSGGIFAQAGKLTIDRSRISGNVASLSAAYPRSVDLLSIAGGVHVSDHASAIVRSSTILSNSATMTNTRGDSTVFSAGLHSDGPITISRSTVSGNHASAKAVGAFNATADSGAGELNGSAKVSGSRFTLNTVDVVTQSGKAFASAGAFVSGGDPMSTVDSVVVSGNRVTATAATGSALAEGGGIVNIALLTLRSTTVSGNTVTGKGPRGLVQGGGIWNGLSPGGPTRLRLVLSRSAVIRNALSGGKGYVVEGGGIYTTAKPSITETAVSNNTPDQCHGC